MFCTILCTAFSHKIELKIKIIAIVKRIYVCKLGNVLILKQFSICYPYV